MMSELLLALGITFYFLAVSTVLIAVTYVKHYVEKEQERNTTQKQ